jgi:hypothetical protein
MEYRATHIYHNLLRNYLSHAFLCLIRRCGGSYPALGHLNA